MTPEEIQRYMNADTSWHDSDVLIVLIMGVMLGGAIFFILGYILGSREERSIKKGAGLRAPSKD